MKTNTGTAAQAAALLEIPPDATRDDALEAYRTRPTMYNADAAALFVGVSTDDVRAAAVGGNAPFEERVAVARAAESDADNALCSGDTPTPIEPRE